MGEDLQQHTSDGAEVHDSDLERPAAARSGDTQRTGARHATPRSSRRVSARSVVYAVLAAVVVLVVLVAADVAFSWGRIHPGVTVSGVSVGAMTSAQARSALTKAFEAAAARPVKLSAAKSSWTVSAGDIGAEVDTTQSVAAAMLVGRRGGVIASVLERIRADFGGVDVTATVVAEDVRLKAVLDRVEASIAVPSRDASVSVRGTKVTLIKSEAGDALDRAATTAALLRALSDPRRAALAVIVPAHVQIADADAQQAFDDAQKLVSGTVTVVFEGRSHEISAERIARCVRFDRQPVGEEASGTAAAPASSSESSAGSSAAPVRLRLVASLDATSVAAAISGFTQGIGTPAVDASFQVSNGKVTVKPSKTGHGADVAGLTRDLTAALLNGGDRTATLRLAEVQPALSTDAAKAMGISQKISSYTTYYSPYATARVNNIHVLADAFNAKLIAPGATFSFNGTAGQRTAEKGYQEAPAIVDGKLVPQLGGGVCQVGTTFFNTVFFAGLPVVERHNHSFYISHYPKGRDATVSWGGPDFKFKNDTGGWILIRTSYSSGSLTIALYGTDPGYQVQYTTSAFYDVVPFRTTQVKDPKLRLGAQIVDTAGVPGGKVDVVRTVYKGGQVVRKDTFVSRYTPVTQVVRVGTKSSTTTTTTPTR